MWPEILHNTSHTHSHKHTHKHTHTHTPLLCSMCVTVWNHCCSRTLDDLPPLLVDWLVLLLQVSQRGGAREQGEWQRKQNGGLHEETPPMQNMKPERTLRCGVSVAMAT